MYESLLCSPLYLLSTTLSCRFADFCAELPADYLIDYVRVYQHEDNRSVGCDTPAHPTREWIQFHSEKYASDGVADPLAAVEPGGGRCMVDANCAPHGKCGALGQCECIIDDSGNSTGANWTGPYCRSQAAGSSAKCLDFERTARHVALKAAIDQSVCGASSELGASSNRQLLSLLCDLSNLESECANVAWNGTWGECSDFARTMYIVQAQHIASGGSTCCDTVIFWHNGSPHLNCRRGLGMVYLWPVACGVVLAVALAVLASKSRKVDLCSQHSSQLQEEEQEQGAMLITDGSNAPKFEQGKANTDESLAALLLNELSEASRDQRRALMNRLVLRCGFQEANGRNQLEHLESLLLSHLSATEGDHAAAVTSLYSSLLGSYERWRLHMSGLHLKRANVEVGVIGHEWQHPDTRQQEHDIALYLLIWGESANLRFMPELLFFLFAIAREHCLTATPNAEAPPQMFLEAIVRPIYKCVFAETYAGLKGGKPTPKSNDEMPTHPRNYDDWNQLFWSPHALLELRTTSGTAILNAAPEARWELLCACDWPAFLAVGCPKFFKEERWWMSMLAANRRLILLHAVAFGLAVFNPLLTPPAWKSSFNGWGTSICLPFVLFLVPLTSFFGATFERWATQERRSKLKLSRQLFFTLFLSVPLLAAAVATAVIMLTHSPEVLFDQQLFTVSALDFVAAFSLILLFCGLIWFVAEMLPRTTGAGGHEHVVFDANLLIESRLSSLLWRSWFKGWSLKPDMLMAMRMYGFWGLVWGSKLAVASFVLIPMLFDGHTLLFDAFSTSALTASDSHVHTLYFALEPARLLQRWLVGMLWLLGMSAFIADTLYWYSIWLGLVGGVRGLMHHGVRAHASWVGSYSPTLTANLAAAKILAGQSAPSDGAWSSIWNAIVEELHCTDLITADERTALLSGKTVTLSNKEARRRLSYFERSLKDPGLRVSRGVLRAPGLTVLVPHYAESILATYSSLGEASESRECAPSPGSPSFQSPASESPTTQKMKLLSKFSRQMPNGQSGNGEGSGAISWPQSLIRSSHQESFHSFDHIYSNVMGFLVAFAPDEWSNLNQRIEADSTSPEGVELDNLSQPEQPAASIKERGEPTSSAFHKRKTTAVHVWASLRLQVS